MKGLSLIIRYILIFIIAVCILAVVFLNIASSTILSKEYILSKLEETNYYEGICNEMQSNFEKYIGQSGLDDIDLKDIITEEKVKNDVNIMIKNIYDGAEEEIDVTEIKTKLRNKIDQFMESNGLKAQDESSIETYINTICDEYTSTMIHTDYEQNINNVLMKVLKYSQKGNKVLLIILLIAVILIFGICYKRPFKGFSSAGVALTSIGGLNIFINYFINAKIKIDTITILGETFSNTLRAVLNEIMSKIANYGYILLISGIVLIIFGNLIDSIKYKDEEEE